MLFCAEIENLHAYMYIYKMFSSNNSATTLSKTFVKY